MNGAGEQADGRARLRTAENQLISILITMDSLA